MKVLVTGGLGFLGSIVSTMLVRKGHKVFIVDDNSHALVKRVNGATIVGSRIWDFGPAGNVDAVFHAASISTVSECEANPALALEKNCVDLEKLIVKLDSLGRRVVFVNASSCAVYRGVDECVETSRTGPSSMYGITKDVAERFLRVKCSPWLKAASLRFSNIVGSAYGIVEGSRIEDRIVPSLFRAARSNTPFKVNGNNFMYRDYLHVMDASRAVLKAISALMADKIPGAGEAYNISSGISHSAYHMAELVGSVIGIGITRVVGPGRVGDGLDMRVRNDLAARKLGWRSTKTLEQAVKDAWVASARHLHHS